MNNNIILYIKVHGKIFIKIYIMYLKKIYIIIYILNNNLKQLCSLNIIIYYKQLFKTEDYRNILSYQKNGGK